MRHSIIQIYLFLLHSSQILVSSSAQCLQDVSIAEISNKQANITWTYVCDSNRISYVVIYYTREQYKSCSSDINMTIKPLKKNLRTTDPHARFTVIGSDSNPLEAFCEYSFRVKVVYKDRTKEEKTVEGATENDLPAVKIRVHGAETTSNEIKFLLDEINPNDCDKFNGDLGYIRYHVKGQNKWNQNFDVMDFTDINSKELIVGNLLPSSKYGIKLFVTDKSKRYVASFDDVDIYDFKATTKSKPPSQVAIIKKVDLKDFECLIFWENPYPPEGEVESYQFSWKADAGKWIDSDRIKDIAVETMDSGEKIFRINVGEGVETVSVKMRIYHKDFSEGSPWSSIAVSGDGSSVEEVMTYVGVAIGLMTVLIIIAVVCARKCNLVQRSRGFKQARQDEYSERPIFKGGTPSRPVSNGNASLANSSIGSEIEMRRTGNGNRSSLGRRSGLDPLPPVPGPPEPLYEPLRYPEPQQLDDENYLVPKPIKMASVESLDDEGYLKPNFNRYQPINTRSPSRESPDPIPMVSYSSQDELERRTPGTDL